MVALIGADEVAARKLCDECAAGEVLVPANFNAPGQIVISGSGAACQRAVVAAEAMGLRAMPLKVAGAFHSPLMKSAADKMTAELAKVSFSRPGKTVYSNVTAHAHGEPQEIKRLLVEQIVSPVRWDQTMQTLVSAGEARFIELAPGKTLAGLAKRINRRLAVESIG
jgi:[acyl-carrier-protein] S-malonyltransferase